MKKPITLAALLLLVSVAGGLSSELDVDFGRNLASMPLAFTENQGQWDEKVLFRADAGGAVMWFTTDGAYYQFTRRIPVEDEQDGSASPVDRFDEEPFGFETMMIKATFERANPVPCMSGEGRLDYKCNYFIGNDPVKWRTDVANYTTIVYEEIYPGVDLKYYGNGREMEYDFVVSPGADLSRIQIRYEGVKAISVNEGGDLVVETQWGEVIERRPFVYQLINGSRVSVGGQYFSRGDNSFGFNVTGEYDKALSLVIDPVLAYSTYLGGSVYEFCYDMAVDNYGSAYVAGVTTSPDFPTENPYCDYYQDYGDAFIAKLNSTGDGLVYGTYLGGSRHDKAWGIQVDASGCAYVVGHTASLNFPTVNAFQANYQGNTDVFVTKLNPAGDGLLYSTYLGGGSVDEGRDIAVDGSDCVYLTGVTESTNFPTRNPYQAYRGGSWDVFVTKLNNVGDDIIYSTYLGGSESDIGKGIAVDGLGCAYVAGITHSYDFPIANPYQTNQGSIDIFVTKMNNLGTALVYSTYLGGGDTDYGQGIALDASGCAYVAGYTASSDFPVENPYQTDQGLEDAIVTKLNGSGDGLTFSTYLGGSGADYGLAVAVDGSGRVLVTGSTYSSDFPTENPFQGDQGDVDAFVTQLNTSGDGPIYSTYLGGSLLDAGLSVAVEEPGAAYVSGRTQSVDFPTENPFQVYQGDNDVFVSKLIVEPASCCRVPGDVDHDGVVDILDFQYLRDYLHKEGPVPPCLEEADIDNDGELTKEDMSCLARYLFSTGNPCVFVECQ